MRGAVAHEHESGLGGVGCLQGIERRVFDRSGGHILGDGGLVGVDHAGVGSHFAQQGLGDLDGLDLVFILRDHLHHLVVLRPVHQVGGLDDQGLDAVGDGAIHGLLHVVDLLAVPGLDVVDDDLGGEGAADGPLGISGGDRVLDALDVLHAAAIEAGAEGDHQDLLLADAVGVAGIVQAGVAGVAAEVIGIGLFTFHQFLLCVGQGVPGGLRGGALGVGVLVALLDIDGVDQRGHRVGGCLIFRAGLGFTGKDGAGMGDIQRLHFGDAAQASDLALDGQARGGEHAVPALFVLRIGHVVVGVIAGHDHQGAKDDIGVAAGLDGLDDGFAGGGGGKAFHGADEHILVAQLVHLGLHLAVGHVGGMRGTMAHEHKGGLVGGGVLQGRGLGVGDRSGGHILGNGGLVRVDDGGVRANLTQQGLGDQDGFDLALILLDHLHHLVVFRAVHQMGGLDDQGLDAVIHSALHGLLHVVDLLAVPGLDVVDDDLGSEGAADGPLGISFGDGVLDALDVLHAAAVEAGAEGDYQDLLLADIVGVAGIVQADVAGVAAEVIGIGLFTLHQGLLQIGEGVPGGLRGGALGVGVLIALLDIDGVDQRGHRVGGCLIFRAGLRVHQHGVRRLVVVHIESEDFAELAKLEEVVAADIVGDQFAVFPVDGNGLGAAEGGSGLVNAGRQLAADGGVSFAGLDADGPGAFVIVHAELGRCAIEQHGHVAELEIVGVIDGIDLGLLDLAVHLQRLRRGPARDAFAGDLGEGGDRHVILGGGGAAVLRLDGGDGESGAGLVGAEPEVKGAVSIGRNVGSQLRVVDGAEVDAVVDRGVLRHEMDDDEIALQCYGRALLGGKHAEGRAVFLNEGEGVAIIGERLRRRQGGSGQPQHQHDGQQECEHGFCGGSFHVLFISFPLVHLSPYAKINCGHIKMPAAVSLRKSTPSP